MTNKGKAAHDPANSITGASALHVRRKHTFSLRDPDKNAAEEALAGTSLRIVWQTGYSRRMAPRLAMVGERASG